MSKQLISAEGVTKSFPVGWSFGGAIMRRKASEVRAVDDVDIAIEEGEALALVGESGAGKTTLGRILCTLEKPNSGELFFKSEKVDETNRERVRRQVQMVFQNPMESLDPRMDVRSIVAEPLERLGIDANERSERLISSLVSVGLDPLEFAQRRARDLSGGQRQRVAVARAIISNPSFVILDEPTSALDASIQAQVLNLLVDLHETRGFTYLLITHNISVAKYMADRIAVMYAGKVVEVGSAEETISNPRHPYTQALLKSVPSLSARGFEGPQGETASVLNPPAGCRYHPRCPYVMDVCRTTEPELAPVGSSTVACWLYEKGKK